MQSKQMQSKQMLSDKKRQSRQLRMLLIIFGIFGVIGFIAALVQDYVLPLKIFLFLLVALAVVCYALVQRQRTILAAIIFISGWALLTISSMADAYRKSTPIPVDTLSFNACCCHCKYVDQPIQRIYISNCDECAVCDFGCSRRVDGICLIYLEPSCMKPST